MRARIAIVAIGLVLGACDTGDGKTLREPTGTLPPPTVPPTSELPLDGVGTLPSLPIEAPAPVAGDFRLIAPWLDGGAIDARHTCDGDGESPALSWADVPAGAVELAVTVVDDSAATATPTVHWVVAGINPNDISLIEATVPLGAVQATNSFGTVGYSAPCPEVGSGVHQFRFTVYALNQQAELADGTSAEILTDFIRTVSIGSAEVIGTYER